MNDFDTKNPDNFEDPLSDFEPAVYRDQLERVLAEESVTAIQNRPYAEVQPTTSVRQAIHALYGLKVASLLVVEDGRLVGIFTERDVLERVAEQFSTLADTPIRDVMTTNPLVVYETDPTGSALAAIAAGGYRHVPVMSVDEHLVGIISPRRVLNYLAGECDA